MYRRSMDMPAAPTGIPAAAGTVRLAAVGLAIALALVFGASVAQGQIPLDPRTLTKYVDPLPIPGVMPPVTPGGTHYEVGMYQISQQLHSQLPPTTVWGYGTSQATASYPAATFEVTRGVPIEVLWTNDLVDEFGYPLPHPLPVDPTLHWADPPGWPDSGVPTVVHVHGAEVESASDGHPDAWFTPGFSLTGPGWVQPIYYYANTQQAATTWYHDHALGITRLNVYMGLAGFYLIRDPANEPANLPGPAPQLGDPPTTTYYEIPIVIQDRTFDVNGQFLYPSLGINPLIHPFWVPEFFGNTVLANGKVWPYLNVEPRKYRFRLLNGSNARFYNLSFSDRRPFIQIGTDGGYLAAPVVVNQLLMAPGERADIVVDFTGVPVGTQILLTNDARSPYPKGAPADPQTDGQIMQFRIVPLTGADTSVVPPVLNTIATLVADSPTRTLTLNEVMGPGGPLAMFLDGRMWDDITTVMPRVGSTEVWEIVNLTADTHPIHLHLTQFQIVNRQRFQVNKYLKAYNLANPVIPVPPGGQYDLVPVTPYVQGKPVPPEPNEAGWKDTVRMNPGEVTRIIVRFAPQDAVGAAPGVNLYAFDPTDPFGPGYVWHCHILEHEDNEMMRRYQVIP